MTVSRDQRIATATAALAAYWAWVDADTAAFLAGLPQPPVDPAAIEQLAQAAQWVLEDAGVTAPVTSG